MANLILGPLIRHIGIDDATIWVETDLACLVEVVIGSLVVRQRTFSVANHFYAIVPVIGLPPGTTSPYAVRLDGRQVWPVPDSTDPPSLIRTIDPDRPLRLLFGSCRAPTTVAVQDPLGSGGDVLAGYARRMATQAVADWPDALLMLGDQVYADETSPETRAYIRSKRDTNRPPRLQVADFDEYTRLYRETWSDPAVRWLLSTVPTSMIFDDHDVLDDWNTSAAWRREMKATDWWEERIIGGLMSYWIYQHLGNLSPAALAADELYRRVCALPDGSAPLRDFAAAADRATDGAEGSEGIMFSYRRDLGPVRLMVVDSRCGRVLVDGQRSMIDDAEFEWLEGEVEAGGYDHLIVATSMPWLLPKALHDLESFDEAISSGTRGRVLARFGEWLRRSADLEHWAAFRASFDRLAALLERVATGRTDGSPPATICVLSGDVHHSYVTEALLRTPARARIFQLTCSPFHQSIPLPMRLVFRLAWWRGTARVTGRLAGLAGVPPVPLRWRTSGGPHFGNHLGVLEFSGRSARFELQRTAEVDGINLAEPVPSTALVLTEPSTGG